MAFFVAQQVLQVLVNLMEHHGKEAPLSDAYRDYVIELGAKDIKCDSSCIQRLIGFDAA